MTECRAKETERTAHLVSLYLTTLDELNTCAQTQAHALALVKEREKEVAELVRLMGALYASYVSGVGVSYDDFVTIEMALGLHDDSVLAEGTEAIREALHPSLPF